MCFLLLFLLLLRLFDIKLADLIPICTHCTPNTKIYLYVRNVLYNILNTVSTKNKIDINKKNETKPKKKKLISFFVASNNNPSTISAKFNCVSYIFQNRYLCLYYITMASIYEMAIKISHSRYWHWHKFCVLWLFMVESKKYVYNLYILTEKKYTASYNILGQVYESHVY